MEVKGIEHLDEINEVYVIKEIQHQRHREVYMQKSIMITEA